MTAFLAMLILICTLSLGTGGLHGKKDAAHPSTIDSYDPTIIDRAPVCRYADGAVVQRDLSSPRASSAGEAAPAKP